MITNVRELREIAKNCADVEFYTSETKAYPHTDNVRSVDVSFDDLKDVLICNYYEMNENEYNNSLCANCDTLVDFEDFYGSSNAKVLVVVFDADHPFRRGEGDYIWECYSQIEGQKPVFVEQGLTIEEARKWLCESLYSVSEKYEQYMSFEEAESDDTVSMARDEDGEVYRFSYDNKVFYIKREDED